MFWDTTHEDLDKKIRQLDSGISSAQGMFTGSTREDWKSVFDLMKEIQSDFNNKVKYPTRDEREVAWQKFCLLRTEAHEKSKQNTAERSDYRMIEINRELRAADWDAMSDEFGDMITFYTAVTTKETMKEKGQHLHEAGQLLSRYKHEMTGEHKQEVFERINRIREQHNIFWGRVREANEEKQKIWEQKQSEFEERKENAKESIRRNIEDNKERLRKAQNALEKAKNHRSELEDQISSAWSDGFRERAEGWLDEENDRIADIEESIDRIEGWIEEGRSRLNSF